MKLKLLASTAGLVAWTSIAGIAQAAPAAGSGTANVDEVVVTATRTLGDPKDLPIKIEVFKEQEIRAQQALTVNQTEMLANMLPSFSPSRQKLTGAGETFRGRKPLYLIDGVPQSTPLRPGGRDGVTIDLDVIQRVEVIFGANAIQGLGGTGGVINYVTISPPKDGRLEQRFAVSGTTNDGFEKDGLGGRVSYSAGKKIGDFDLLASGAYEARGLMYDAKNRSIGIDNEDGDIADTDAWNLFFKGGWEPTENQRLQVMVNRFRIEQQGNYVRVDGNRTLGIPAVSKDGTPQGQVAFNNVTTLSADYTNKQFLGGHLSLQGFYQDFHSLFGGQITASFQDPLIAPVNTLFDQSQDNSEKYGAKFAYGRNQLFGLPIDGLVGVDALRDKTSQPLVVTGRVSVPPTTFKNYAPFIQMNFKPFEWVTLTGGLRHEYGRLTVADYVARAGNRKDFARTPVKGGKLVFNDTLGNVGLVVNPFKNASIYASSSQAFSVPDVGRVLRSVATPGLSIANLLDLKPINTKNQEVGAKYGTARYEFGLTYFKSTSKFGQMLIARTDGTFDLGRQATETSGWEATGKVSPTEWLSVGGGYSKLKGRFDSDANGSLDSDLGAADIGPNRLNLYADLAPAGPFSFRVQSFTYYDKSIHNKAGAVTASFNGFTTLDASASMKVHENYLVSLSINNLLDKQYFTYFSQAATAANNSYYAGRGRALTLRIGATF